MAFKARQVTLSASTATDVFSAASLNKNGNIQDPTPIQILNTTATAVYVGGSDVDSTHGLPLAQNVPFVMNAYSNDYPFVWSAGTPTIIVLAGRQ